MAITNRKSVYPFAECVEVTLEGTTSIDLMDIPAGAIIEKVLVRIKTAGGTGNVTVGDDDDADGFIVAADQAATAGTVYGDGGAELGAYLVEGHTHTENTAASYTQNATTVSANTAASPVKLYASAGKEIKIVGSAATASAALQVIVIGKRYHV